MLSWVPIDSDSEFSLDNLPYGIFGTKSSGRRAGVAIGNNVLDLKMLVQNQVFSDIVFDPTTLEEEVLNRYAALGRDVHRKIRERLQTLLRSDTPMGHVLRDNPILRSRALLPLSQVEMYMPMNIGDYTDFFTSSHHAKNCTEIFQPGQPLSPGFYNMPLGYGGRASSVVVSGTPVRRPRGQYFVDGEITFGPCQMLDYEVELGAFVGHGNEPGSPIDVKTAEQHIFGLVLLNDWSARDIQRAEAGPVGPLNGKSFCTSISPWIVTLDALEPYRTKPDNQVKLLPCLDEGEKDSVHDIPIDVHFEVGSEKYHSTQCNTKNTCFSLAQMLTHLTSSGCLARPGDLFGTGTLSGSTPAELGCLLEASWGGVKTIEMKTVSAVSQTITRSWIEDGDTVHFSAKVKCRDGPGYIGFGGCSGKVLKAL